MAVIGYIHVSSTKQTCEHQYSHILQNLKRCPRNYFVNGAGLEILINDIIKY